MSQLQINLNGDGAFADLADRIKHKGVLTHLATLDGGMGSGNPSVALAIELENGDVVFAETSVKMFQLAAAAILGKYGDLTDTSSTLILADTLTVSPDSGERP